MSHDEKTPLVNPGIYRLAYQRHETKSMFRGKAPKLYLHFNIIDNGPAFGCELCAYYNVRWINGKKWKVGFKSNFLRDYVRLFGEVPDRLDRIPMTNFKNCIIRGRIKTVERGANQKEIPKPLQYSVIEELIEVSNE